jgi:hypothetical protein
MSERKVIQLCGQELCVERAAWSYGLAATERASRCGNVIAHGLCPYALPARA